jgi:hypothetical protein
MSSILKVDTIQDQSGNNIISEAANVITIGASGDTITVPAGATVSGFTSSGIDDNATSVAITIDSAEKVGILNTTPGSFHVSGNDLVVGNTTGGHGLTIVASTNDAGSINFADGSSSNASFRGKITYEHSNDSLAFHAGAAEKFRVGSNGNFSIGTTADSARLNVSTASSGVTPNASGDELFVEGSSNSGITIGSGTSSVGSLFFADSGDDNRASVQYLHASDDMRFMTNGNVEKLRITSTGSIGIGEEAPLGLLHVKSADSGASANSGHNQVVAENSGNSGMTILSGTSSNGAICFGDSGNNCIGYVNYAHNGNHLDFGVNGSEKVRILSDGKVGIGTTSADYLLTVGSNNSGGQGNASSQRQAHFSTDFSTAYNPANSSTWSGISVHNSNNSSTRTSTGITFISRSGSSGLAAILSTNDGSLERGDLRFITRGDGNVVGERMRIDDNGNVGIGTASPSRTLSVFASTPILALQNSTTGQTNNDGFQIQLASDDAYVWNYESGGHTIFGTNNNERMRILSDGKVGIGTTSPSEELEVSGSQTTIIKSKTTTSTALGGFEAHNSTGTSYLKVFQHGPSFGGTTFGGVTGNNQALIEAQAASSVVFSTQGNAGGSNPDFIFAPQRTERVRILSSGKIFTNQTAQFDDCVTIGGSPFTGDFQIEVSGLTAVTGNQHKSVGMRLTYRGVAADASNGQNKDVLLFISGLSSWSSVGSIDTGGGTVAISVNSATTTAVTFTVTSPASTCVGAYVATLFANDNSTMETNA